MTANQSIPHKESPRYNLGDLETFKVYLGSKWRISKNMYSLVVVNRSLDPVTLEVTIKVYEWENEKFTEMSGDKFIDAIQDGKLSKI